MIRLLDVLHGSLSPSKVYLPSGLFTAASLQSAHAYSSTFSIPVSIYQPQQYHSMNVQLISDIQGHLWMCLPTSTEMHTTPIFHIKDMHVEWEAAGDAALSNYQSREQWPGSQHWPVLFGVPNPFRFWISLVLIVIVNEEMCCIK